MVLLHPHYPLSLPKAHVKTDLPLPSLEGVQVDTVENLLKSLDHLFHAIADSSLSNFPKSKLIRASHHVQTIITNGICRDDICLVYEEVLEEVIFIGNTSALETLLQYFTANQMPQTPLKILKGEGLKISFETLQKLCFQALTSTRNKICIFDFLRMILVFSKFNLKLPIHLESSLFERIKTAVHALDLSKTSFNHADLYKSINMTIAAHFRNRIAVPKLYIKA